ncbi:MAG: NAD(P)-dependent oxidoreductase [Acidimicrobiia bacterium]
MTSEAPTARRLFVTGGSGFIGSALVREMRSAAGWAVLNYDTAGPTDRALAGDWIRGDVLDLVDLRRAFADFRPTDVVHLAARVDVDGKTVADYAVNTEGTANVIRCVVESSTERVIVASTQFVCRPGYVPGADDDYRPHTAYGESKAEAERLVRAADVEAAWTIIRPTTIWGPGDLRYRSQFYRVMARGLYVHPSGRPAMRSYGYVGNVVDQIRAILESDAGRVRARTLYVGDPVAPITDFVEEFARQLGRQVRTVPRGLVRSLAVLGDVVTAARLPFPITTGRFRSMVEDYPVPIDPTFEITGAPRFTLEMAVSETVGWLREAGFFDAVAPAD